ncbi:MAG: Ig-like domain-containing protein [Bacteroidia bacterium]
MKFNIKEKIKKIIYRNTRTFIFIFSCCLIVGCAQVVAPGGGPVDKTAPKAVKYLPDSATLNFKSRSIQILFNEFFTLNDLPNQLIISPPLENKPIITVKNKTLNIQFDEKEVLKPTTTYCISFGNAIQDLNEKNPVPNFKYIFSTGNYIDSITLSGTIQNAFDHKLEKGVLALLYKSQNDSAVYNSLPEYFAKTTETGAFEITNIKSGSYKLLALKDANANYKFNQESESIAFAENLINVDEKNTILLNLFQELPNKIYLKKYIQEQYGKYVLILNRGADSLKVKRLTNANEQQLQEQIQLSKNKDTITYWINNYDADSIKFQIKNGAHIIDTAAFKVLKKEDALKSKRNPFKLSLVNSLNENMEVDLNADIFLQFSNPILNISKNVEVDLKEDTLKYKKYILSFYKSQNSNNLKISIGLKDSTVLTAKNSEPFKNNILKENTKYSLNIPPNTFKDFFGLTNDSIKIKFKTRDEKYYGSVKLNLNFEPILKGKYIVQLLDDKENIVRENSVSEPTILNYLYLQPRIYKLKIIADANSNGKWDTGNYLLKQQPENVFYNKESINIRSNWDLDLEWNVNK